MKRNRPLRRGKALTAKNNLARKTRMKQTNRARKAKRYAVEFGDYSDVIRALPCDTCGAPPPSDPSHAKSRGAGGKKRHLFPQCRKDHQLYGDGNGITRAVAMERADFYWRLYGDG